MTLLNQLLKTVEQKLSPEILLIPQVVWSVDSLMVHKRSSRRIGQD
jgi:hypothetical protein